MGRGLKSFASNSNCDINQFNSQLRSDAFTLAQRIKKYNESKDVPFFSMEFFPPQSADATINLISRLEKIREANPMFCDVTWHGTGTPDGKAQTSSLNVAGMMLNYCGITAMSHVTCVSVDKNSLHLYLERAKELGVRNVLALRGDKISEKNLKQRDFTYAADMVKYIRQNHGDFFTIGVAGYPCKHPEAESYEKDIQHLKEKVDCGADFIITQFFFESDSFIKFAKDCRQVGIKVPISAGIMPIQNYSSLKKIIRISGIEAPKHILDTVKENAAFTTRVQKYGIDLATDMCKQIIKSGSADGLHFYTLNNENSSVAVLKNLGLWHTGVQRPLPWLHIPSEKRFHEEVRPIFWRNRTKSYLFRTSEWNIFPKRKWSEYSSQSYKTLDENYYMCLGRTSYSPNELLEMWGKELSSEKDIWDVFYNYVSGSINKYGIKVTRIPWSEGELNPETNLISEQLARINARGFLTINSQPNINGADSTDPIVGWGASGGYVYQKAYLEFFTRREYAQILRIVLDKYPWVNYHMVNCDGKENYTNSSKETPIAVIWGVFPGAEIVQPTVVDPVSFMVWKDEAFSLWRESWAKLYPEDSQSRNVLDDVVNNYFLVNLVDNKFKESCCLWNILDETYETRGK